MDSYDILGNAPLVPLDNSSAELDSSITARNTLPKRERTQGQNPGCENKEKDTSRRRGERLYQIGRMIECGEEDWFVYLVDYCRQYCRLFILYIILAVRKKLPFVCSVRIMLISPNPLYFL